MDFAKLRENFALYALRAFALSCIMRRRTLRAFTYTPCLRTLRVLFIRVKIVLGWICSPGKALHFSYLLKTLLTVLF